MFRLTSSSRYLIIFINGNSLSTPRVVHVSFLVVTDVLLLYNLVVFVIPSISSIGSLSRFERRRWHRRRRSPEALHITAELCERLGPGLPASVDQRDAVLDRSAPSPCATAAGRSVAHDARRRTQAYGVSL